MLDEFVAKVFHLDMKSDRTIVPPDTVAIGATIRELRRRAHLEQGELARRIGIRQGSLCNIELGKTLPSTPVLIKLAHALNVTVDRILHQASYTTDAAEQQTAPAAPAADGHPVVRHPANPALYLTSDAMQLPAGDAFTTAVEVVVRDYLALEDICRVPRQARVPLQVAFEDTLAGIERLATQYRTLLGIGDAVVFDLLELFENHGLRVVFMPLRDAVPAFSCYDSQNGNVFIFIHAGNNPEKQIFALAYELGRVLLYSRALLLATDPFARGRTTNKNARYFAACFLMPELVVRNSVSQAGVQPDEWDLTLLLRLKHRFGVSAETFNYRLLELGLITAERQQELRTEIHAHYQAHAFAEPGNSRRILTPNGRLGDLLHTALRRDSTELPGIRNTLDSAGVSS